MIEPMSTIRAIFATATIGRPNVANPWATIGLSSARIPWRSTMSVKVP